MSFGRANRPQTPVGGIIRNDFGEESANYMQQKYAAWNQMKSSTRGLTGIRMTNAQIAADNAIKAKLEVTKPQNEQKPQFKLTQNPVGLIRILLMESGVNNLIKI